MPEYVYIVISGEFEVQSRHPEFTFSSPTIKVMSKQPKRMSLMRVMQHSVIGFDDVVKARLTTMSFKCVTQGGRLLLLPSSDIFQVLQSDFVLKTKLSSLVDR